MKKVVVGSENPAKIEAVRRGFEMVWPDEKWEFTGVKVPSGVSDQPMSDIESIKGARTRARRAFEVHDTADFAVGSEGGLEKIEGQWFDCGWIVVRDKEGREGIGSTVRMQLPDKISNMILEEGKELGEVIDTVFGTDNAKQKEGFFGLMTKNTFGRTEGYRDAVVTALSRFIQSDLFS